MARHFSWSEVAVSAAKGAAVVALVFGGALWIALDGEPGLPWLLLGCAAASYALCFVLVAALHWQVARQLASSGPPPTRFPGGRARGLVVALLVFAALALCALWVAEAARG
jgi:hypothetical protein